MTDLEHHTAAPPRIVGRYALFDEIAAGGMATVHLGRLVGQVGFSRTVAVKRLHPQYAKDADFVSMFVDEAKLASRIQHPNVVSTLDVVKTDEELFLVMEYVQGESLSKLVRQTARAGERIPVNVVLSVMSGMLHGLHAAHEAKSENREPLNLVHRDISPQNVLVGVDGVARVLDFGVAKAQVRSGATKDGQMKGKLSYMSPEQLNGLEVDRRSDIFAAGIVLWEALAGRRLFAGADTGEILGKVLNSEIPTPHSIAPEIPETVSAVVMKALERNAVVRFQTAREFAVALEQAAPGATAHTVGEWVKENGGDELSHRANLVASVESHPMDGLEELNSRIENVRSRMSFHFIDPMVPAPDDEEFGAVLLERDAGKVRRGLLLLAAVALLGTGAYLVVRNQDSVWGTAIPAEAATRPPKVPTKPPAPTVSAYTPPPSLESVPHLQPSPSAGSDDRAVSPGAQRWRPTPKPSLDKGCSPPFTIDEQGIKKPKLHCL
jgi:eukaryotic-like serine/threonine-protein kinase